MVKGTEWMQKGRECTYPDKQLDENDVTNSGGNVKRRAEVSVTVWRVND